jgi:uncharacterized protein (TIGR02001 family)
MKNLIKPVLLASLLATALSAQAADETAAAPAAAAPASPHTLSTNIGFFTDYTFRGISYTRERGAVQGGIDYSHSSGIYLGVWGTNVHNAALYGNTVEVDVYGGYIRPLTDNLSMNVGFLLTYKYFTLKHSYAITNFFGINDRFGGDGDTRGSGYTELNFNYKLPVADLNLALHVGRQTVRNYSQANYTDWLVGVNKDFSIAGSTGWNAGLNYTTTDADDSWYVDSKGWETGNDRLIGYIKRTF